MTKPIFGEHKHNRTIRRLRCRGLSARPQAMGVHALAANVPKLYQHRAAAATA